MLSRLEYEGVIGEGAFALVSRYRDNDGKKFAVKKLKSESKRNPTDIKRFKREIAMLEELKDEPNIVALIDYNAEQLWYIMPYAEENLYKYISRNNSVLKIEDRVEIFENIIDGISIAHSKSILHRDITPNNILRINGDWYICDFGLGKDYNKHTLGGYSSVQGYGSYNYAAPEQIDKLKDATIQSDIYSLGKVFYFILTGREPRDISEVPAYFSVIKGASSERVEDRFENIQILKRELVKHKELYSKLNTTNISHMTIREYLLEYDNIDWDEFYELSMKSKINEHIYYDLIEPTINHLDTTKKLTEFTTFIGMDKSFEFIKLFNLKLNECYAMVGWPFSALNSFGYFLNRFYIAVPDNPSCQLECLKEIWNLAAYHDQWAIQDLIISTINNNQVPKVISDDFAFHILEVDRSFVKMNKINTGQIESLTIVRAIQALRG